MTPAHLQLPGCTPGGGGGGGGGAGAGGGGGGGRGGGGGAPPRAGQQKCRPMRAHAHAGTPDPPPTVSDVVLP